MESHLTLMNVHDIWKHSRHAGSYCQDFATNSSSADLSSWFWTPYFHYEFGCSPFPFPSVSSLECHFLVLSPSLLSLNQAEWNRVPFLVGGVFWVMKLYARLSISPHSLTFQLTCLINNADCLVNDSFTFWEGKSLHSVHLNVAHAHGANLAYHSEYFRLLSS